MEEGCQVMLPISMGIDVRLQMRIMHAGDAG